MASIKTIILTIFLSATFTIPAANAQSIFDRVKKAMEDKMTDQDSTTERKKNVDLSGISTGETSDALKQALNMGVKEGIQKLGAEDGFFKNELVKILLPKELQKVDAALRRFGLSSLADQGLLLLNRAAEDAVKEGAPIFANAITSMTFDDAKDILLGDSVAATNYLKNKTSEQLFAAFKPKVENSLGKVGADKVWEQIITKYNGFTRQSIETDLNAYVTQETVSGVFKMVAEKENELRDNPIFRTTSLLKKVFGAVD
ncbi:DUF4197 domain-containing protein [Albibacterium profundi]|uniref:DUF4197 domain-containing protein n=1 Tax=Albibacterium profundi TaxID=3134906 RepID=A0ABV5CDP9_9SPHI